jgi:hypothetical protein
MDLIVPTWPLFVLAGLQSIKYLYRFYFKPTSYILLGKAFTWMILSGVYIWAEFTTADIITVRSVVRLGLIIWMSTDLLYFMWDTYLKRKYGRHL